MLNNDDLKALREYTDCYNLPEVWEFKTLYEQIGYLVEVIGGDELLPTVLKAKSDELKNIPAVRTPFILDKQC